MRTMTISQRLQAMRSTHSLRLQQLFVEGRTLVLQMVRLQNGATGCEWTAESGDSLHDALDECEAMLNNLPVT